MAAPFSGVGSFWFVEGRQKHSSRVDSFSILLDHRSFFKNRIRFPWVSGGFLERKNGEGTPELVALFFGKRKGEPLPFWEVF